VGGGVRNFKTDLGLIIAVVLRGWLCRAQDYETYREIGVDTGPKLSMLSNLDVVLMFKRVMIGVPVDREMLFETDARKRQEKIGVEFAVVEEHNWEINRGSG